MAASPTMTSSGTFLLSSILLLFLFPPPSSAANGKLFGEYIGAEFKGVKFSDVNVNGDVDFHFILAFAIDATTSAAPTDGRFNIFWDSTNLSPSNVASIKKTHRNVQVAVSLGGDTVGGKPAYFTATSVDAWVANAVTSLKKIINDYHLDGIDIDYEHFKASPDVFAESVGRLITKLKQDKAIKFASIAPFDNQDVQAHYLALYKKYARVIDYVNFQFYAYDKTTTVKQFLGYYEKQSKSYPGGKVLVSLASSGSGGLTPERGFFTACQQLKKEGKLHGIFIWSADDSKANGFRYEKQAQAVLAAKRAGARSEAPVATDTDTELDRSLV